MGYRSIRFVSVVYASSDVFIFPVCTHRCTLHTRAPDFTRFLIDVFGDWFARASLFFVSAFAFQMFWYITNDQIYLWRLLQRMECKGFKKNWNEFYSLKEFLFFSFKSEIKERLIHDQIYGLSAAKILLFDLCNHLSRCIQCNTIYSKRKFRIFFSRWNVLDNYPVIIRVSYQKKKTGVHFKSRTIEY